MSNTCPQPPEPAPLPDPLRKRLEALKKVIGEDPKQQAIEAMIRNLQHEIYDELTELDKVYDATEKKINTKELKKLLLEEVDDVFVGVDPNIIQLIKGLITVHVIISNINYKEATAPVPTTTDTKIETPPEEHVIVRFVDMILTSAEVDFANMTGGPECKNALQSIASGVSQVFENSDYVRLVSAHREFKGKAYGIISGTKDIWQEAMKVVPSLPRDALKKVVDALTKIREVYKKQKSFLDTQVTIVKNFAKSGELEKKYLGKGKMIKQALLMINIEKGMGQAASLLERAFGSDYVPGTRQISAIMDAGSDLFGMDLSDKDSIFNKAKGAIAEGIKNVGFIKNKEAFVMRIMSAIAEFILNWIADLGKDGGLFGAMLGDLPQRAKEALEKIHKGRDIDMIEKNKDIQSNGYTIKEIEKYYEKAKEYRKKNSGKSWAAAYEYVIKDEQTKKKFTENLKTYVKWSGNVTGTIDRSNDAKLSFKNIGQGWELTVPYAMIKDDVLDMSDPKVKALVDAFYLLKGDAVGSLMVGEKFSGDKNGDKFDVTIPTNINILVDQLKEFFACMKSDSDRIEHFAIEKDSGWGEGDIRCMFNRKQKKFVLHPDGIVAFLTDERFKRLSRLSFPDDETVQTWTFDGIKWIGAEILPEKSDDEKETPAPDVTDDQSASDKSEASDTGTPSANAAA